MSKINKTLAELERKLQKIEELSGRFSEKINTANLKPLEQNAAAIEAIYENLVEKQRDFNSEIDTAISSFQDILGKIKQSSQGINQAKKELGGLTSIAQKLQDYQRGYNDLTTKQLKTLQTQAQARSKRLEDTSNQLKSEKDILEASIANYKAQGFLGPIQKKRLKQQQAELKKVESTHEDLKALIDDENVGLQSLNKELDKSINLSSKIGDQYDLASASVDGLSLALDKLGLGKLSEKLGIDDAKKEMGSIAKRIAKAKQLQEIEEKISKSRGKLSDKQIKAGFGGKDLQNLQEQKEILESEGVTLDQIGSGFDVLKGGLKSMGKSLKANLLNPTNQVLFLVNQLFDALKLSDKGAGELAKGFNMTYAEANATRGELSQMAALSGDVALNTKGLQETMMAIGNSLGSNAMLNKESLGFLTKMREQAGYTNDELVKLNKLSAVNNKTEEETTKEILGGVKAYASQKGLVLNEKQILQDILKTSDSIKLSLGGGADELAKAAVEARAVGLNLEQADKIASGLLNFESSIAAELEAELLLGKDINLEKARQAALNNDLATVAKEIAKETEKAGGFSNMNRVQQEALAKSMQMSRDELATMLIDQEALTKLSAKEGESAQQAFNRLVKEVGMEEAKKRLGDDQLATQFQQQSVQERFQQGVMKLQELFIQLAEPVLAIVSPLADLVGVILPAINILLQPLIEGFSLIGEVATHIADTFREYPLLLGGIGVILTGIYRKSLATAITSIFTGLGTLGPVGLAMAGVATMGLISLAGKYMTGDDVLSPGKGTGGYGDRTLFGPEGAIQLNNKDTVIAGTDLFADDMVSAPKGQIQVSNTTAKPKETKPVGNGDIVAGISQLNENLSGAFKFNQVSGIAIQ